MTEIRYRRLLALYPSDFRREYEEEMLGVLMADNRPGPGQVADLVRAALAARLRQAWAGRGEWGRAARMGQVFGALMLFAIALRRVVMLLVAAAVHPELRPIRIDGVDALRTAGWALALAGAVYGLRALGAIGATAGLIGEIVAPARYYLETPATVLHAYWLIVTAVGVLIAGLVAQRGPIRLRGWVPMVSAGVALVAQGVVLFRLPWIVHALLPWVALVLVGLGVQRLEPAVRRRVVAWAVPVLVTFVAVEAGFAGFVEYNMRHPESLRLLGPLQWTVLVLIPVVTFAATVEAIRRIERHRAKLIVVA